MISLEKWMILAPLQKLPKNVKDLGKLIVQKGIKKLPKVQKIANYGHTAHDCHWCLFRPQLLEIWPKHFKYESIEWIELLYLEFWNEQCSTSIVMKYCVGF